MSANDERAASRIVGFLHLVDEEGCRHLVRLTAVQMLSDVDPCRDGVILIVAGRGIRIPQPLDELLRLIETA